MQLLLDTHILLWWLGDDPLLSVDHRRMIQDSRNACFISAASVWEISIKRSLGKLEIDDGYLEVARSQGFIELPIRWNHAEMVKTLPEHHRDPFDRMLVAQAVAEEMTLLTVDQNIRKYEVRVG